MANSRASKGFLVEPVVKANFSNDRREKWLREASAHFASKSLSNREYYAVLLEALWPVGHGIPGPLLTQDDLRAAIDAHRGRQGKPAYKDVFRRVRELQGEEGFTSIVKEGVRYQLQSLETTSKREPRSKPSGSMWKTVKAKIGFRCAHCGQQEPSVQLSPDHKVPRSRGGNNDEENWQPLCEQCNILKSSSCQGCAYNCYTCSWAFPESYKPIAISDSNKEQIRRLAEKRSIHQGDLVNSILTEYFNASR